jgi:hypothetical protein
MAKLCHVAFFLSKTFHWTMSRLPTCAFACLQLEFLERKVYRLENNVMLLSSLIGRLLDERDVEV